jgi:O-antigen/teichoic acid export membrane protein
MKDKLFRDISFNTVQVLVNQFLGIAVFLLISRYLDKPAFGEFSWSLAVLTFITTILSLRLEQVIVRNVAAGRDPSAMLTLFMAHNLVTGTVFFLLLSAGNYWFPAFFTRHSLLWVLSISQLLSFFSLPFRQLVTGRSAFGWLAVLSSMANLIRAGWLLWIILFSTMTIQWVLIIFTVSSLVEFGVGGYIVSRRLQIPFSTKERLTDYRGLIKSSMPQAGVVMLNAGIARMDWILLGIFTNPSRTAEYSFAYKAFELSPLPLIILAPLLLNRFSRSAASSPGIEGGAGELPSSGSPGGAGASRAEPAWLDLLVRWEMVAATFLPLLLNIAWTPLVDALTHHKYGQVNALTFLILSCCIPFQYLVNVLWTHEFAANKLALIFRITAITAAIILTGDLLLIPVYAGPGAALAYLAGMIVQYLLYSRYSSLAYRKEWKGHLLVPAAIAICSGLPAIWLTTALIPRLSIATGFYCVLICITGKVRAGDLFLLRARFFGNGRVITDKIYYHEVE